MWGNRRHHTFYFKAVYYLETFQIFHSLAIELPLTDSKVGLLKYNELGQVVHLPYIVLNVEKVKYS